MSTMSSRYGCDAIQGSERELSTRCSETVPTGYGPLSPGNVRRTSPFLREVGDVGNARDVGAADADAPRAESADTAKAAADDIKTARRVCMAGPLGQYEVVD